MGELEVNKIRNENQEGRNGERKNKQVPSLQQIKKQLPSHVFEKNLMLSMYYFLKDFVLLTIVYNVYRRAIVDAEVDGIAFWTATVVYWNIQGFLMWCVFVVGHDCGHTSFSNSTWINDVVGHICHAVILVPFYPWQKSHRLHHTYHNHYEKDMSHKWYHRDEYFGGFSWWVTTLLRSPVTPFFSFGIGYLLFGIDDGSHYWPFSKLFNNTKERIQCAVSSLTCIAFLGMVIHGFYQYDMLSFAYEYVGPYLIFNFWLFMVTYLQHHDHDSEVFDDTDFNYVRGAFESIDRTYGWGIDDVHHNISDCHVIHHLFFTQIPHYRLKEATEALRRMEDVKPLYKSQSNWDFLLRFIRLNWEVNYFHSVSDEQYARKCSKQSVVAKDVVTDGHGSLKTD